MGADGLFAHVSGPYGTKRHDLRMLRQSGLKALMLRCAKDTMGNQLQVYADKGYSRSPTINSPLDRAEAGYDEPMDNDDVRCALTSKRVCVEWGFGNVVRQWDYLNGEKRLKSLQSPIGQWYVLGMFLTNCHVTVYGTAAANQFNCRAPSLETYLQFF